mmetsp:Transcript_104379/g.204725  ORF Transcript_104379/g.204725 Transcript_104379/m.204725 type:complete len:213 (+) Transcript_104379:494-1132(+)
MQRQDLLFARRLHPLDRGGEALAGQQGPDGFRHPPWEAHVDLVPRPRPACLRGVVLEEPLALHVVEVALAVVVEEEVQDPQVFVDVVLQEVPVAQHRGDFEVVLGLLDDFFAFFLLVVDAQRIQEWHFADILLDLRHLVEDHVARGGDVANSNPASNPVGLPGTLPQLAVPDLIHVFLGQLHLRLGRELELRNHPSVRMRDRALRDGRVQRV